jgi:putative transcriptional regulator
MTTRFRLREILDDRGISQVELVKLSGVAARTVARLCANSTGQVSLETLDRLAKALDVEPGDIIARAGSSRGRQR